MRVLSHFRRTVFSPFCAAFALGSSAFAQDDFYERQQLENRMQEQQREQQRLMQQQDESRRQQQQQQEHQRQQQQLEQRRLDEQRESRRVEDRYQEQRRLDNERTEREDLNKKDDEAREERDKKDERDWAARRANDQRLLNRYAPAPAARRTNQAESRAHSPAAAVAKPRCAPIRLPHEQTADVQSTGYFVPTRGRPYFMTSMLLGKNGNYGTLLVVAKLRKRESPASPREVDAQLTLSVKQSDGNVRVFRAVEGDVTLVDGIEDANQGQFEIAVKDLKLLEDVAGRVSEASSTCFSAPVFNVGGSWVNKGKQ